MKSLTSYISESTQITEKSEKAVPGCIFCVDFLHEEPNVWIVKENSSDIYTDIKTVFKELSEKNPEYKLQAANNGSKANVFGIAFDSEDFILGYWEYNYVSFKGYGLNVIPAYRGDLKFIKDFPNAKKILSNFSYKGDIEKLKLVLYTYKKLTAETYINKPHNKWGDYNGILISREKAGVSTREYRYDVDVNSIKPEYLIELYPNMKFTTSNGAINGTFEYLEDKFKIKLNTEIRLD